MSKKTQQKFEVVDFLESADFRHAVLCDAPEKGAYWKAFLREHPQQRENIQRAKLLLESMETDFSLTEEVEEDTDFVDQLEAALANNQALPTTKIRRLTITRRWFIAASILFLVGLGGQFLWSNFVNKNVPVAYAANFGELKIVTLPDGSKVHLNANSSLTLTENWQNEGNRKVWLQGEAFFEVNKIPTTNAKFSVVTEGLTVEVLGTQFNVNTRSQTTEVYLEEGKIQLKMDELTQAMIPGEVVNFSKKTQAIVSKNTLTAEKRGNWRNGILTLKEEKVANILQEIEMIYGLEVELKNEVLANETRTMAFPINQLELTISILEKTLATTITHQGNRLIVE